MRIHTSATRQQVESINVPGVTIGGITEHRSHTHQRAFEVGLAGSGREGGAYGRVPYVTATWDEWGVWLNRLYEIDPDARCGSNVKHPIYADRIDFRICTGGRFDDLTLSNQHRKHKWEPRGDGFHDCHCGATRSGHVMTSR